MAAWSETSGTKVVANIIPTSTNDLYPTHIDIFGRGGYKAVTSLAERDAIKISRLCLGAEVRVTTAGGSTVYYVSKMPDSISDNMTGADCEWTEVKGGGLDEDALASLKGQPNGLAELDNEGLVPESQSRSLIFRGKLTNDTTFESSAGRTYPNLDSALYIDSENGYMYIWLKDKYVRKDTMYWIEIK